MTREPKSLICRDPSPFESWRSLRAWRKELLAMRANDPDDLSVDWALESLDDTIKIKKEYPS